MPFCNKCGNENPENVKFCGKCGNLANPVAQATQASEQSKQPKAKLNTPPVPVIAGAVAGVVAIVLAVFFLGGGSLKDSRDGKKYRTVKIGDRIWMAENLNYSGKNGNLGACYEQNPENCKKYGALYFWTEALIACPDGWHLPWKHEWDELLDFVGGKENAGKKLKAKKGWNNWANNRGDSISGNGMDDYGFAALPGGFYFSLGRFSKFSAVGEMGSWWGFRNNEFLETHPYLSTYSININHKYDYVTTEGGRAIDLENLNSVRCVKDIEIIESEDLSSIMKLDENQSKKEEKKSEKPRKKAGAGGMPRDEAQEPQMLVEKENKSGKSFTDDRDGKSYKIAKIGKQTWMAENLNFNAKGSECYDKKADNCAKYGRLYNWNAAKQACPEGWHLPSDAEWSTLTDFIGDDAGKKLKAKSGWDRGGNGTDNYGFSALPGGLDFSDNQFNNVGSLGRWWSSTENRSQLVWGQGIDFNSNFVGRYEFPTSTLFSIRCVKD